MLRVRPVLSALLYVCASGCDHRERESPADQVSGPASIEPIVVRRGQRNLEVRCERSCGPAQVELSRLQRGCVRDPSSNVHHISERPAMIQLGCCVEAQGVYGEACGNEGSMGACVERWSRYCERGTLLELDEPSGDQASPAGGPT